MSDASEGAVTQAAASTSFSNDTSISGQDPTPYEGSDSISASSGRNVFEQTESGPGQVNTEISERPISTAPGLLPGDSAMTAGRGYPLDTVGSQATMSTAPLRLQGGAVSEQESMADGVDILMAEDGGNLTDSTEEDVSMQVASSSRQASAAPDPQNGRSPSESQIGLLPPREGSTSNRGSPSPIKAGAITKDIPPFKASNQPLEPAKLYVCEGCFKYTQHASSFASHHVGLALTAPSDGFEAELLHL